MFAMLAARSPRASIPPWVVLWGFFFFLQWVVV
jgi:hypothetical protein